ncbi:hypothetical protein MPPM_4821 [Methylorubrum populi]|uniref:ParB/Sulfiredoxin domain-containing protein n=1 Tax=Methylorubrum populi TaxID=223967 RepID=A0A160PK31_9HYPH|nr:hypothetical protein [Methylorubrum populi]BAU93426.1 hypothetical protein MPPM_4821 [Methylorubrum populi]
MTRRPITLPRISIQNFDPTADCVADKRKGAAGEAARPVSQSRGRDTMLQARAPQTSGTERRFVGRNDGINRSQSHAEQWYIAQMARGEKEVFSEQASITPEIAALLLNKNPDNRNLSKKRIGEIRADLESGRYVLNGEPIIVSKDGLLNDGQHRLIACVESGVTFRTIITFGVTRSSRLTLDQGGARTVADYLDMQGGGDNTKVAATVARMLWQYQKLGHLSSNGKSKQRTWPTKAESLVVAAENEREIAFHLSCVQKTSRLVGSLSFVVLCRIVLARADATMGAVFIDRLLDGSNLKPDSPIFVLRERFINDPKMRQPDRFEAVVRAWNAMRKGKTLGKIQIMGSVPKVEA